jgi:hypothetical protein
MPFCSITCIAWMQATASVWRASSRAYSISIRVSDNKTPSATPILNRKATIYVDLLYIRGGGCHDCCTAIFSFSSLAKNSMYSWTVLRICPSKLLVSKSFIFRIHFIPRCPPDGKGKECFCSYQTAT